MELVDSQTNETLFKIPDSADKIIVEIRPQLSLMGISSMWERQEFLQEDNPVITPYFFWKGEYCELMHAKYIKMYEKNPDPKISRIIGFLQSHVLAYRSEKDKALDLDLE